jgi:hypothetical protein
MSALKAMKSGLNAAELFQKKLLLGGKEFQAYWAIFGWFGHG